MNLSKNTSKMFNLLVIAGSLTNFTQANENTNSQKDCRLKITKTHQLFNGKKIIKEQCLDEIDPRLTLEEIDESIKIEIDEDTCLTPFCNCWLG